MLRRKENKTQKLKCRAIASTSGVCYAVSMRRLTATFFGELGPKDLGAQP